MTTHSWIVHFCVWIQRNEDNIRWSSDSWPDIPLCPTFQWHDVNWSTKGYTKHRNEKSAYLHLAVEARTQEDMQSYHRPNDPDDGGSHHLWNVGQFLRDYTAQDPRRQSLCLTITPWKFRGGSWWTLSRFKHSYLLAGILRACGRADRKKDCITTFYFIHSPGVIESTTFRKLVRD
jgi:hypothetical protein